MAETDRYQQGWKVALVAGTLASGASAGFFLREWYLLPVTIVVIGVAFVFLLASTRMPYWLMLILTIIAWFPEFSQTEWDVYTAKEAPSIYNFRPLPAITASIFDYLFAGIVLWWLVTIVMPEPRKLLKVPLGRPVLTFLGLSLLSLVYGLLRGNEPYYALKDFRVSSYFCLIFLMFVTTHTSREQLMQFVKFVAAMAAGVGIYGVMRFLMGIGKQFGDVRLIYYDIADSVLLYIVILGAVSLLMFGALHKKHLVVSLLLGVPIVFSFVFSFRRGAWLAFLCGLLFLMFLARKGKKIWQRGVARSKVLLAVAGILVASILLVRGSVASFALSRLTSITDFKGDTSNVFRVLDSLNALSTFVHHPIMGVGFGGSYELINYSEAAAPPEFWDSVRRTCHNGYLFLLYKMGLPGFLSYAFLFVSFFRDWKRDRATAGILNAPMQALFMSVGAIVVAMLANNVPEPFTDTLRPATLLAFVLGIGAALSQILKTSRGSLAVIGLRKESIHES